MKIALSQKILQFRTRSYDCLEREWYSYLSPEHTIFALPNVLDQDFKMIAEEIDAFIITGGEPRLLKVQTELSLVKELMLLGKPILGICHGAFLLSENLGGIRCPKPNHHYLGYPDRRHFVKYKGQNYEVNSYHNIGIKKPHESATILATDEDGDCEAWIDGNMAGCVWHPERMQGKPWLPDEIKNLLNIKG